jgi:hypothetical protein
MPSNVIQPAFTAGELSPGLAARVDLASYHVGASLLENFFVDYKGGASSRPGTQFIDYVPIGDGPAWLYKFVFSSTQQYVLVFCGQRIGFIRNPGTAHYPNGSNSGYILSAGVPYLVTTPYTDDELPDLKFAQSADILQVTHPNHPRMILRRLGETNWTFTVADISSKIASPGNVAATISALPSGSTDPGNTTYLYTVTSVGKDGEESPLGVFGDVTGVDMAITPGTVTVTWNNVNEADYYNVYKTIPGYANTFPPFTSSFGFCGIAYGTLFTDSNIIPDFTKAPPLHNDPFSSGRILAINVTSSSSDWPVGHTTISITGGGGGFAYALAGLNNSTLGGTGAIVDVFIAASGRYYTSAPTITAVGGGTSATFTVTLSGTEEHPTSVAYNQQRLIVAGTTSQPTGIFGSKTGFYDNFDRSNPILDDDSFTFVLASSEVNAILHMISMPGGLLLFTNSSIQQLTGGSSSAQNPAAITPSSAVVVPQSYFGASRVRPAIINSDIVYTEDSGTSVQVLAYNLLTNTYTSEELTAFSSHLFFPRTIVQWDYQHVPNKILWAVRDDGILLSLTFLKEQKVFAWTHHRHGNGNFQGVTVIREGVEDVPYFIVERGGARMVERLAGRLYDDLSDAWCVDSGLSYQGTPTTVVSGLGHLNGYVVDIVADGQPYAGTVSGGAVTIPVVASKIVVGIPYTPKLQSLQLDLGNEGATIQGKRKRVAAVTVRVRDTSSRGLRIGTTWDSIVPFVPNVSSTDNMSLSPLGLMTADQRLIIDPSYNVPGQICIEQEHPFPVTVLGIIPEIVLGDTGR